MPDERMKVLIAGGGVAGIEALLALKDLAGDRVEVTLAAPTPEFVYKPLTVEAPFSSEPAIRLDLAAAGLGGRRHLRPEGAAAHRRGSAHRPSSTTARPSASTSRSSASGRSRGSPSATPRPCGPRASRSTSTDFCAGRPSTSPGGSRSSCRRPESWPLPVYELALMTERRARELSLEVRITIVTPEPEPLGVFGHIASDADRRAARRARDRGPKAGARAREGVDGAIVLEPGS